MAGLTDEQKRKKRERERERRKRKSQSMTADERRAHNDGAAKINLTWFYLQLTLPIL